MTIASRFVVATLAAALLSAERVGNAGGQSSPRPPILDRYRAVTSERLLKPADGDWLMVRRTYDGWGYSPLAQITPANVGRLQPVWMLATDANNGHEAPPIVSDGVMFVATPGNQVIALDATNGHGALALPASDPGRRRPAASDDARRGASRRQGVLRRGRGGARRARRAHRQRGVDDDRRREQERLLHVAGAAGR